MRIRRFEAPDTKTALAIVKEEMGEDAIILATRTIAPVRSGVAKKGRETWVEVVAAMDYDLETLTREATDSRPVAEAAEGGQRPFLPGHSSPTFHLSPPPPAGRQMPVGTEAQDLRRRFVRQGNRRPTEAPSTPVRLAHGPPAAARPKAEEVARWRDQLIDQLQIQPAPRSGPGNRRIMALVGATGVGKTTTAAKLAAWRSLRHGDKVALISMDCYRIGATDQLRTYARIMRLPCEIAMRQKDFQQALARHRDKDLLIIDTAGKSPFDRQHIAELQEWFSLEGAIEPHLVISATAKREDLAKVIDTYGPLRVSSLLVTKLDETRAYAALCQQLAASTLPVSYLCTGQRVPEDFLTASKAFLEKLFKYGWQAVAPELQATANPDAWQEHQHRDAI